MLLIYRILFLPVLMLLTPAYLLRMSRRGGYRSGFTQRFGEHPRLPAKIPGRPRVWLQAVSVGELLAIGPLLEALHRDGVETYLTVTTSTGHRLAGERYRQVTSGIGYFPLDWWYFVVRTWRRIEPDLVVLVEGERWPELLWQAASRGVPVVNINARLSDQSYARLLRFRPAGRLMFTSLTRLLPCSERDAMRFEELGVPRSRMVRTGNIKLDVAIPLLAEPERAALARSLGLGAGRVLLGSSTWPGEEEALVAALRAARDRGFSCTLLLVPRHAERRPEIERRLRTSHLRYHFRTDGDAPGEVDVVVADTTGELRRLTQLADVVFIGKSLPPHTDGQTPVEAAALGRAMLLGPGMGNFREISRDLISRGAAREVADANALADAVVALLANDAIRRTLGAAAARWQQDNAGAIGRTLAVLREEILRSDRGREAEGKGA